MGLIAVDKLNRKVLGYICRNGSKNNSISYCCVLCDVEYEAANLLETHMLKHELRSQQDEDEEQQQQQQQQPNEIVPDENEGMEADTTNGTNGEINNIPLTQEEIENRLRSEHDLKDCSIQLFRFEYDIDDLQSDADDTSCQSTSAAEEGETSNEAKNEKSNETKTLRKRNKVPSARGTIGPRKKLFECEHCSMTFAHAGHFRRHYNSAHPSNFHICFICAKKFVSIDELTKHQEEHSYTDSTTPVIPCPTCGQLVRNLKRHMIDHKLDSAYEVAMSTSDDNMIVETIDSIDDSVTDSMDIKLENRDSFDANGLQTIGLEVEYIVTSDSEYNVSTTSNIQNGIDLNDIDIKPPKPKSNCFPCEQCGKRFRIKVLLEQHLRNHERPRVPCSICGKRTTKKYSRLHMLRFHRPTIDIFDAEIPDQENDVEIIEEMYNVG